MEDPSAGPRNEGHTRYSITGTGPPGNWCHATRVCFLSFLTSWLVFGLLTILDTQRQLHSSRPPLSDVPAIYFVAPTLANIRRIAQDLQKDLYESFHLNFSEPLPRSLLEELAAVVAKDGTNELVDQVSSHVTYGKNNPTHSWSQVVDQYLSFIAPSASLYSLLPPPLIATSPMSGQSAPSQQLSSYSILNSPSSAEDQIESEIERIANGLFSVVATMGT